MPARTNMLPTLQVGDKVVQVGPPSWSGWRDTLAAADRANLRESISSLDLSHLKTALPSLQSTVNESGAVAMADVIGAIAGVFVDNLPTLYDIVMNHAPVVEAVILAGSNLTAQELADLDPGQVMKVFNAAAGALEETGVFGEMLGFFLGRLGLLSRGEPSTEATSTATITASAAATETPAAA